MTCSPFVRLVGVVTTMLLVATLSARASALLDAIDADDVILLQSLSRTAPTKAERDLAAATVLSLYNHDVEAEAAFRSLVVSSTENELKAAAEGGLAGIFVRQSRFAEAESALKAMRGLREEPLNENEQRTLDFVAALRDVPSMRRERHAPGTLAITRDRAGMTVATMLINGREQASVLDTGAVFSVVPQSTADRLQLSAVASTARTGSSTGSSVETRLAVADRIEFGDTVLRDALFMVVPDEGLRFPDGYRIDAIIGLPVMRALDRLEFVRAEDEERWTTASDRGRLSRQT